MFGGFSGGSDNKESTCNAGDAASIPGDQLPNPVFLDSCMERGHWQTTVHGVMKGQT